MELRRFFVPTEAIAGDIAVIEGDEYVHMTAVLRFRVGYRCILCDNSGLDRVCEVVAIDRQRVTCRVLETVPNQTELNDPLWLHMGVIKQEKFEMAVQKAVELGVQGIQPFISTHTDEKQVRFDRARRIIVESCKQCGRAVLPTIEPILPFADMIASCGEGEWYMAYENERGLHLREALAARHRVGSPVHVIVGSEGGFTADEVDMARAHGITVVGLGKRILRAETASILALGLVTALTEAL